jgi:nitrogen fixation/metabolism regulation signal transduction histidine kinase
MNPRLTHDRHVMLGVLLSGLPAMVVALVLIGRADWTAVSKWTLAGILVVTWLVVAFVTLERVVRPLQTLSNLLSSLREGDFSFRGRGARRGDPLGEVLLEANALGEILSQQRLGALEATALLRTVMAEIDLAVFAFDDRQRLKLVNRTGERLLAQPSERLIGRTAAEVGLAECLEGDTAQTLQRSFPGATGRWGMRRSAFRQGGLPHQLLVLSDLSRALREEERQAWQRLLRVLGHELNNSLAPIKSISASLASLIARDPLPADWRTDARQGMEVITARTAALSRFVEAYSKLARLPEPRRRPLDIPALAQRVAGLETRLPVEVLPGPALVVPADADQLEQLLINLVRNATDASLQTKGRVRLGWVQAAGQAEITVADEGPGLSSTANLFVPFFTTKPGGTGIGLTLSRQIAEAHGGSLSLQNRPEGGGCIATLRLPLG